jgi:hypothetical protein
MNDGLTDVVPHIQHSNIIMVWNSKKVGVEKKRRERESDDFKTGSCLSS